MVCPPLAGGLEIVGPGLAVGDLFTEAELAAADLLVQLSGSAGGADDEAASDSGSPRSVNTGAAWAEEREAMTMGLELDRRATKRYRLVSELYDATRRVDGSGEGNARKRKRGPQPEAAEMTTVVR